MSTAANSTPRQPGQYRRTWREVKSAKEMAAMATPKYVICKYKRQIVRINPVKRSVYIGLCLSRGSMNRTKHSILIAIQPILLWLIANVNCDDSSIVTTRPQL